MKTNKLIIAAAGSGKTTFLVNEALRQPRGSVLITTYTQANEAEIRKKFAEINGCIPTNVTVQTWFSTLLQHGVRPYQGGIFEETIKGMHLVNERSGLKYATNGKRVYYAEGKDLKKFYFTKDNKIYSDKISKFVVRCNEASGGAVIDRLARIFTHVFIDEVQDLAGYDLELIKLLLQSKSTLLLVGDPRQVTYLTHYESKYGKYNQGRIKEFIQTECRKSTCQIDEKTLNRSYRNNAVICKYSSRLYPDLNPIVSNQLETTEHDGVFLVKEEDIEYYLKRYEPMQLRDNVNTKVNTRYKSINFGESKGLTFDRVLIYPTKPYARWINNNTYS